MVIFCNLEIGLADLIYTECVHKESNKIRLPDTYPSS